MQYIMVNLQLTPSNLHIPYILSFSSNNKRMLKHCTFDKHKYTFQNSKLTKIFIKIAPKQKNPHKISKNQNFHSYPEVKTPIKSQNNTRNGQKRN